MTTLYFIWYILLLSPYGLLRIMLLRTSVHQFLCGHVLILLGISTSETAELQSHCV